MIVPIEAIPKVERRVLTDQRKMLSADIELAIQKGYRLFEITGDDYNYDALPSAVVSTLTEYYKTHFFNDIWKEHTEQMEQHFRDGHEFKLSAMTIENLGKKYYKVRSLYDPALGRKRVFVELDFDEADIRKNIQEVAKQEKERHAMHVRRKRALSLR